MHWQTPIEIAGNHTYVHIRTLVLAILILLVQPLAAQPAAAQTALEATPPAEEALPGETPPAEEPVPSVVPTTEPTAAEAEQTTEPTGEPAGEMLPDAGSESGAESAGPASPEVEEAGQPDIPTEPVTTELAPTIAYAPDAAPVCIPAEGNAESISSGGSLDYDCTAGVSIRAHDLDPAAVVLSWSLSASSSYGWSVQLRRDPTDEYPEPEWTEPSTEPALLTIDSTLPVAATSPIDTRELVRFQLRISRPACAADASTTTVVAELSVSTPAVPETVIEATAPGAATPPQAITPELSPVESPVITVTGSLDFGDVAVDAAGVRDHPESRPITVTVSDLARSCGDWTIVLSPPSDAASDARAPLAGLRVLSVGAFGIPGGCAVDDGCAVAVVHAGPHAPEDVMFTIELALELPDRPGIASYIVALAIALEPGIPDGGTLSPDIPASAGTGS